MNYRCMDIGDYDAVVKLWRSSNGISLREADSREGILRYLTRNPGLSFVAEKDNEIIGTIMAGHDGRRGYVQHLAVCDMLRGQGIAGCLVELCLQALKQHGISKSHIHVLKRNHQGRQFWARRGWFKREEVIMYSFINGDNPDV